MANTKDFMAGLNKEVSKAVKGYNQKALRRAKTGSNLNGTIKVKENHQLNKLLAEIADYEVYVGIPFETSGRNNSGINNAELAYIQSHGVHNSPTRRQIQEYQEQGLRYKEAYELFKKEHGDPAYHIPPRPILEPAIKAHSDEITKYLSSAMESFIAGDKQGGEKKLKATGMQAQNFVKGWFTDPRNEWPPNAPSTVAAWKERHRIKGDAEKKPLIDTAQLRNAITYVLNFPSHSQYFDVKTKTLQVKDEAENHINSLEEEDIWRRGTK